MTARIFALFFALLTTLNLLGDLLWPGFDGNLWWISFGALPAWFANAILAVSAVALFAFAFRREAPSRCSRMTVILALSLAGFALANTITFFQLLVTQRITAGVPVPFSLLIFGGMLLVAHATCFPVENRHCRSMFVIVGGIALFGAFPLALMLFFGNTDYRRPADAVVVFGARAYQDGRLSDALEDRIRTACELYRAGSAKKLVLSGGPGDGAIHETEAMRRYALNHGVRAGDIFLDRQGLNTEATVRNTIPLFRQRHMTRVLAVSHFYHLPRIKLSYQRAGFEVYTVPARQKYFLRQIPYSMAREVAAFWTYYLKERPAVPPAKPA